MCKELQQSDLRSVDRLRVKKLVKIYQFQNAVGTNGKKEGGGLYEVKLLRVPALNTSAIDIQNNL